MVIPMDLTLEDSADELFRKVGEFDVGLLVNNAGFGYYGKFVKQAPERFSDMIKLNILTFTLLTRKFADRFIKKGREG